MNDIRYAVLELYRDNLTIQAGLAWTHAAAYPDLHQRRAQVLHPNELAQYENFTAPRRMTSFLLGRAAAKRALSLLLPATTPDATEIVPGVFTQPIIKAAMPEPLGVSISHVSALACALAFPQIHPMAIDVECLDANNIEAMKSQALDGELSSETLSHVSEVVRCTLIWTAKEALSKVLKCGMMSPFSIFETIEIRPEDSWWVGYFRNFGQYKFHAWVLPEHVVTIVLPKWTRMTIDLTTCMVC